MHDAANILRRYFNQLPEPIIPLGFYDRFRDPIRNHQAQAVGHLDAQSPSVGEFDHDAAIRTYQALITELPPLNRQLLLYILDLLAVFASKSDLNKMTTQNLSAIFQPGILSHPQHDMAPPEYRLSQDVLIFLIDNQDSFLIGMQGTAADSETVREVQAGVNTPSKTPSTPTTPNRAKTVLGRSTSNASAGAESVRKWGSIRRNVSVTSKNSKRSEAGPTPVTPALGSPGTPSNSSGVYRSNTVPSRRGNNSAQASPRVSSQKSSDPPTPSAATNATAEAIRVKEDSLQSTPIATSAPQFPQPPNVLSASSSEATTPLAPVDRDASPATRSDYQTPRKDTTPLLSPTGGSGERELNRSVSNTPSSNAKGFLDIFKQSPGSDGDGRKPNKLRKKQYPGSSLSSAHSSSHSLHEQEPQRSPLMPAFPSTATQEPPMNDRNPERSNYATAQTTPTTLPTPQSPPQRSTTETTLKPTLSPSHSFHSNTEATDASDADMAGDEGPRELPKSPEKEKKRSRWRLSRTQNKLDQSSPAPPPADPFGSKENTTSRSTVGSSTFSNSQPRRSFQEPTPLTPSATDPSSGSPQQNTASAGITPSSTDPAVFSDSEREKRGPMSWIRGKIQERKDKEDAKRSSTPERHGMHGRRGGSRQDLGVQGDALPVRGKSFEAQRQVSGSTAGTAATGEGSRVLSGSVSGPQGAPTPAQGPAPTSNVGAAQHPRATNAPSTALPPQSQAEVQATPSLNANADEATTPTPLASGSGLTIKTTIETERPPVAMAVSTNGASVSPQQQQSAEAATNANPVAASQDAEVQREPQTNTQAQI